MLVALTKFGLELGAGFIKVERWSSDGKTGAVWFGLTTPKGHVQIRVTKTGKVAIYTDEVGYIVILSGKKKQKDSTDASHP